MKSAERPLLGALFGEATYCCRCTAGVDRDAANDYYGSLADGRAAGASACDLCPLPARTGSGATTRPSVQAFR